MSQLRVVSERDSSEKPLPSNVEVERMILGVILLDNTTIEQAIEHLNPSDMSAPSHRRIYERMLEMHSAGEGIDPMTVCTALKRAGELDGIGGPAYVAGLIDGCPRFSNIQDYVRIVKDASILRQVIKTSNTLMQMAFSDEEPANAILARAERLFRDIEGAGGNRELVTASEAGWKRLEEIEAFQASGRAILGIGTGLYELDRLTGGLIRGNQHLFAARPSMGKTALGVRVMDGVATSRYNESPVQVFFTMEMSTGEVMDRWLFGKARVDQMKLRANRLAREDYRALGEAQKAIDSYHVIVDQDCRRPSEMRGVLRKIVQRYGRVDVFYVDHIGKASPDQRTESRRLDIAAVSADFKEIAKEFDCAGVILCQLNRVSPGAGDKEPELHHLAESGNLEQDADMVIYPHRPFYYDKSADPREAKVGILKQRNGPSGVSFPLTWFGEFSWFENAASDAPVTTRKQAYQEAMNAWEEQ